MRGLQLRGDDPMDVDDRDGGREELLGEQFEHLFVFNIIYDIFNIHCSLLVPSILFIIA